jgi:hypothetical protein
MKRCALRRKEMVLFASDTRAGQLPSELEEHIVQCPACRNYWKEIKTLCALCGSAAKDSSAPDDGHFHHQWMNRIRELEITRSQPRGPFARLASWSLRAAMVALVGAVGGIFLFYRPTVPRARDAYSLEDSRTERRSASTLLNYQLAAGESAEALDALMELQSRKSSAYQPIFTVLTRREGSMFD